MCEGDLAKITGQKPVTTNFKKSISNFKTRKGTKSGLKVTLRKDKMYEFVDRLVKRTLVTGFCCFFLDILASITKEIIRGNKKFLKTLTSKFIQSVPGI